MPNDSHSNNPPIFLTKASIENMRKVGGSESNTSRISGVSDNEFYWSKLSPLSPGSPSSQEMQSFLKNVYPDPEESRPRYSIRCKKLPDGAGPSPSNQSIVKFFVILHCNFAVKALGLPHF